MESQNASAGINTEMCCIVQSPGETFNERWGMSWLLILRTNMQKYAKRSVGRHGFFTKALTAKRLLTILYLKKKIILQIKEITILKLKYSNIPKNSLKILI